MNCIKTLKQLIQLRAFMSFISWKIEKKRQRWMRHVMWGRTMSFTNTILWLLLLLIFASFDLLFSYASGTSSSSYNFKLKIKSWFLLSCTNSIVGIILIYYNFFFLIFCCEIWSFSFFVKLESCIGQGVLVWNFIRVGFAVKC